jgi:hypothetical protein
VAASGVEASDDSEVDDKVACSKKTDAAIKLLQRENGYTNEQRLYRYCAQPCNDFLALATQSISLIFLLELEICYFTYPYDLFLGFLK